MAFCTCFWTSLAIFPWSNTRAVSAVVFALLMILSLYGIAPSVKTPAPEELIGLPAPMSSRWGDRLTNWTYDADARAQRDHRDLLRRSRGHSRCGDGQRPCPAAARCSPASMPGQTAWRVGRAL